MFVFAYGSLLWNPGFPRTEALPAVARGWKRSWCVRSTVHRGSPEAPGIVLGLVPGGSCVGMAYRVESGHEAATRAYLHDRETAETGYRLEEIEVLTTDGTIRAACYVAEGSFDGDVLAAASVAAGGSGRNSDYIANTVEALRKIKVPDGWPAPCHGLPPGIADLFCPQISEEPPALPA